MMLLDQLRRLYSLDTLDTRFTATSSSTSRDAQAYRADLPDPARGNGQLPSAGNSDSRYRKSADPANSSPSRWKTPEFICYFVVFFLAILMMLKVTFDVSKESHPNYEQYSYLLSPGWIAGRQVDNSDRQYSGFRNNLPYLLLLIVFHPSLRRLYNFVTDRQPSNNAQGRYYDPSTADASRPLAFNTASAADVRLELRTIFDFGVAIVFIFALHGISALKIILILYANFQLATRLPQKQVPLATWIFGIGILFANELCGGYRLERIARLIMPRLASSAEAPNGEVLGAGVAAYLDGFGGLMPRWEVLFKVTVLRIISFNMDYYWSLSQRGGSPIEVDWPWGHPTISLCRIDADIHKKKQLDPANLSERDRLRTPARPGDYSFRNYVAYTLYSPLYLAGPIITFNDYISQMRYPSGSITTSRTIRYGIRFLVTLLCMEVMLHFFYVVAIAKARPTWGAYTPFQLSMLGYFNLHIIWLKLLLPWRFFRLWALIDGVDPPENMVRCMSDNYSAMAFWRGWHRSYNRWIVRYIYVPLGGSDPSGGRGLLGKIRAVANFLIVFTFVALWHDIQLQLLIWGWLVSLFVVPEVVAGMIFPKRKWLAHPEVYRIICGIGAVGNILMMMAANLVGFAIGLDGLRGLVHGIVGSYSGLLFLVAACCALFTGTQVMFEIREDEMRQGIQMKC